MKNEKWFELSIDEIEKKLKTNAASGLSLKAARSRSQKEEDSLFVSGKKSIRTMLYDLFADFSWIILLIAAILSWTFGEVYMGGTVTVMILINAIVSFLLYYRYEKLTEDIHKHFMPTVKVIRGGKLYNLDSRSLVVGDVVILEKGDTVCCDARLVTSEALKVSMMTDRDKYIPLSKQAEGRLSGNMNLAENHVNMVHAGSVVEEGSARAVVVGVGRYTYIAAKVGKIEYSDSDILPAEIKKIKRISFSISLAIIAAILPFCIVSLLVGNLTGGDATLSVVFLTSLALAVSTMSKLSCSLCKIFFINKMRSLINSESPMALRSSSVFDKLSRVKYLFLLDGSPLTDGRLHFDSAFCADCEVKNFDVPSRSSKYLSELASLYFDGESMSLSRGVSSPDKILMPIDEFLTLTRCDRDALKIRCRVVSCHNGDGIDGTDKVIFSDRGVMYVLSVSGSADIIDNCRYCYAGGQKTDFPSDRRVSMKNICLNAEKLGKRILVFSVSTMSSNDSDSERCFAGVLILSEGIDKNALEDLDAIKKMGVRVITFTECIGMGKAPLIPRSVIVGNSVSAAQLSSHNLPLTYNFGKIDNYTGFSESDICSLLKYAHGRHEGVAVIGFTDYAPEVLGGADVFITTSELDRVITDKNEMVGNEARGDIASSSCMQMLKTEADVIIQRPSEGRGGLSALGRALSALEVVHKNLKSFWVYMLACQAVRIFAVAIPTLMGRNVLDARHILLCSFFIDTVAMFLFARSHGKERSKEKISVSIIEEIRSNKRILLTASLSALICTVVPYMIELTGIFGIYLYKTEYMTVSLLILHFIIMYAVKFKNAGNIIHAVKNKIFIISVASGFLFLVLLGLIPPFGLLFGIEKYPFAYLIMSAVLPFLFYPINMLFAYIEKRKKA